MALSTGLDMLLENYHDQLPQLDAEIMAGATAYDLLKFGIGFARECGQNYGTQEAGLVPRCLWDNENPLTFAAAYYAGFIDGAWEIAEMGYSIAEFSGAWNPLSPVFHTQTGADIRQKTIDVLEHLHKLTQADDTLAQVKTFIGNEVEKYVDETLSLDAQGRYNQGKLIFEVASAFFGVAEAKALLKTGKLTSNLMKGLTSIPTKLRKVLKPTMWERILETGIEVGIKRNTNALETIADVIDEGLDPIDTLEDAIQTLNKTKWEEIKALFKRGNDFNRRGRVKYIYNEVNLIDGKRLDSYIPGKEIISRKATTLNEIQASTFEGYLRELTTKYQRGKSINAPKFGDEFSGEVLSGDYFLEIPASNKAFYESSQTFQKLAEKYNVQIKYLDE